MYPSDPDQPVVLHVDNLQPYTPGPAEQAEIADLVAKHRQRGPWLLVVAAADLNKQLRDGETTLVAFARALAARVRESAWGSDAEPTSDLGQLLLEMAECENEEQAQHLLGLLYDAADDDRVWIEP